MKDRAQQLRVLQGQIAVGVLLQPEAQHLSDLSGSETSGEDITSSSSDSEEEVFNNEDPVGTLCELYSVADSIRYHEDNAKFLKSKEFAETFFSSLPNVYFRHVVRMDKESFWTLVGKIKDHPIFHNRSPRDQLAVSLQLAATLDRLGHSGNGAALKRSGILWGVSTGSVVKFMHRCITALEVALADAVTWPDRDERSRISSEFAKHGFPGCVGLIDGTLLPLSQRPKIDGEVYFDRNKRYSVNMQVVCNDKMRILHIYTGMPGSCSDLHCIQDSPLWRFRDDPQTFDSGQYLLGDSGYPELPHIVAAFKNSSAASDPDKEAFNLCVSKARVISKQCISVLKSRWGSLKELKTQLKGAPTSVWMIRQIECCVRLHNFVIDLQDEWRGDDQLIELETDDEADIPSNANDSNGDALHLRNQVMSECLAFNRTPGGLIMGA